MKFKKLWSFWLLAAMALLLLLLFLPYVGFIFTFFGVGWWIAYLLVAFMASIVIEVLLKKIRLIFLIIPICFYSGYYYVYSEQIKQIEAQEIELQNTNPSLVVQFDANKFDLLFRGGSAVHYVKKYKLPVIFETNSNYTTGHFSYRLLSKAECDSIEIDIDHKITKNTVSRRMKNRRSISFHNVCLLGLLDSPTKPLVEIIIEPQKTWRHRATIEYGQYSVVLSGKEIAKYRTASVYKYSSFPLIGVGCNMRGECGISALKSRYVLKTTPKLNDGQKQSNGPISLMLGLDEISDDELANFKSYESNKGAILKAQSLKNDGMVEKIEQFELFLDQKIKKPPQGIIQVLILQPDYLRQKAEEIVEYLELKFIETKPRVGKLWEAYQERVLFSALSHLPNEDFVKFMPRFVNLIKSIKNPDDIYRFYIRIGDLNTDLSSIYFNDIVTKKIRGWTRFMPYVGLCRQSKLNDEIIAHLKNIFLKMDMDSDHDMDIHEVVTLGLIKHGHRDFVLANINIPDLKFGKWYQKILDGEGDSPIGPNNCIYHNGGNGKNAPYNMGRIIDRWD